MLLYSVSCDLVWQYQYGDWVVVNDFVILGVEEYFCDIIEW